MSASDMSTSDVTDAIAWRGDDEPEPSGAEDRPLRERPVRVAVLLLGLLVVMAAVGAGRQLLGAASDLQRGRDAAERGLTAARDGEVEAAHGAFLEARGAFASGGGRARTPLLAPVAGVPGLGDDLGAVRALADAGRDVSAAGALVAGAVADLGGVGALAPQGGALPVDALRALGDPVARAAPLVARADAAVAGLPAHGLVPPVEAARSALVDRLAPAATTLREVEPLVRALPALLGADGERRYLFGAGNPAELRGATGFIGASTVLTIDAGRLSFGEFGATADLVDAPPGTIPPPSPGWADRYDRYGGTGVWRFVTMSPDFPSTGVALERLHEATTSEQLDGAISADPYALAALLEVAGPVDVPGFGPVSSDDVVRVVAHDAYGVITDTEERKRLLGDVAAASLTGFLQGLGREGSDPLTALRALGGAVADGHLVVHAVDPEVQQALEAAGVAGRLGGSGESTDFVQAHLTGASNSKVDWYLERELDYRVELAADGSATADAELRLRNTAPSEGQVSYVIGPNTPNVPGPGGSEVIVSTFLDQGAELERFYLPEGTTQGVYESELGHFVMTTVDSLAAGATTETRYRITNPSAWTPDGRGGGSYRLTVGDQPAINAERLEVEVVLPPGASVVALSEGLEEAGGRVRGTLETRGERVIEVVMAGPEPSTWERLTGWLDRPVVRLGG